MQANLKKETIGNKTFLTYLISDGDNIDETSIKMLKNNKIKYILPVTYTQIDEKKYLKYEITSMNTVSEILNYSITSEKLLAILRGILGGVLGVEDYMIMSSSIILSLDKMFFDEYQNSVKLVCFPINVDASQNVDLKEMVKSILSICNLKSGFEIYGMICSKVNASQNFSPKEFLDFINSIATDGGTINSAPVQPAAPAMQNTVNPIKSFDVSQGVLPPQPVIQTNSKDRALNVPGPQTFGQKVIKPNQENNILNGKNKVDVKATGQNPNIPPAVQTTAAAQSTQTDDQEEHISLLYLLQHYNSENAEKYKKQKASKKGKSSPTPQPTQIPGNIKIPGAPSSNPQESPMPVAAKKYVEHRPEQKFDFGDTTVFNQAEVTQSAQGPLLNKDDSDIRQNPSGSLGGGANHEYGLNSAYEQPNNANANQNQFFNPSNSPLFTGNEGTTVLGGNGTTVLADNRVSTYPYLIRLNNFEKVFVNKPSFRVGKERSYVDYFVMNNNAVSRIHADIITRDGRYFIKDNHSTNRTFVNGTVIPFEQEYEIFDGDAIMLANEGFEFHTK